MRRHGIIALEGVLGVIMATSATFLIDWRIALATAGIMLYLDALVTYIKHRP